MAWSGSVALLPALAAVSCALVAAPGGTGDGVPCPTARAGLRVAGRPRPTEAQYLAVVRAARDRARARLSPATADHLAGLLARAEDPALASNLGALLVGASAGSAGLVALCDAALRDPSDPVTANNLAAALKGAKQLEPALVASLWSEALAPDMPVTLANRGWIAVAAGDTAAARSLFERARGLDPDNTNALAGLALLAHCRKEFGQAMTLASRGLSRRYSGTCAGVFASAREDAGPKAGPGQEPQDWMQPRGVADGAPLVRPRAPFTADLPRLVAGQEVFQDWLAQGAADLERVGRDLGDLRAAPRPVAVWEGSGTSGRKPRHPDEALFVLSEWRGRFGRQAEAALAPLTAALEARMPELAALVPALMAQEKAELDPILAQLGRTTDDRALEALTARMDAIRLKYCTLINQRLEQLHRGFHLAWTEADTNLARAMDDYHRLSSGWLAELRQPAFRRTEELSREATLLAHENAFRTLTAQWVQQMGIWYRPDCHAAAGKPPAPGRLKPWPADARACRSATSYMKFLVASFESDCDKFKVEFGEGVILSVDYKFGKDWGDDECRVFLGAGVKGALGPVSAVAKGGWYATFQGGRLVDAGDQVTVQATTDLGPFNLGAKLQGRLSLETGAEADLTPIMKVGPKVTKDALKAFDD